MARIPRAPNAAQQSHSQDRHIEALQRPGTLDRGTVTLSGGTASPACPFAQVGGLFIAHYLAISGTPGFLVAFCNTAGQVLIQSVTSAGALNTADTSTVVWMAI